MGATLARLNPSVHAAALQHTRANFTLAQAKYDRTLDLAACNFISGQAKDEAKNKLRVAQAVVGLADARLAKMTLSAPLSGIIGLRVLRPGITSR
jgi:membrane fusion protein (multidrug efflux system)